MIQKLSVLSNYSSAGGLELGTLNPTRGFTTQRIDGENNLTVFVMKEEWQGAPNADIRLVLKVVWHEGTVEEYRISKIEGSDTSAEVRIDAVPLFADLVTCGPVYTTIAGVTTTRVSGNLLVSQWCNNHIFSHSGATSVNIVLGTVEKDIAVELSYENATPGQILRDVATKSEQEVEIVRTNDSTWTVNFKLDLGASVPELTLTPGVNMLTRTQTISDKEMVNVVIPLGDVDDASGMRATIADVKYRVEFITGSGPFRLGIYDWSSARGPIMVDNQWQGVKVVWPNGSMSDIIESRASDSSIVVSSTFGTLVGDFIGLRATATTALTEVFDTGSVNARGRRAAAIRFAGTRGERNEILNGRFSNGLANWSPINATSPAAYVEVQRTGLNRTLTGTAAARAAGTGTGTNLSLTIGANEWIRQSDVINIGGSILNVASDVIPNNLGALSIPVSSPGLPGNYASGTSFNLIRRETRTWLLDGNQSIFTRVLKFKDSGTDQLPNGVPVTLVAASGGFLVSASSYMSYRSTTGLRAGTVDVQPVSTSVQGALDLTSGVTGGTFKVLCTAPPTIASDGMSATIVASGFTAPFGGSYTGPIANVTRVRWLSGSGQWLLMKVTAVSSATLTLEPEDIPFISVPSSFLYNASTGFWEFDITNTLLADNSSWTATMVRETRSFTLNGSHVAGALTILCNAQSNIATRNWLSTDTITLIRNLSGTFDLTSVGSVTPVYDFDEDLGENVLVGYTLTCTFNAGTSTMDDVAVADYPVGYPLFQSGTSGTWRLSSIVGTTVVFDIGTGGSTNALPTGVVTSNWIKEDTYTLTGTASWGNNGRVTLNLAAAVPAGRSYARGLSVRSNWHTSGMMVLHTQLNAGAAVVEISGTDQWFTATAPTATVAYAVYRVMASGSTVPIPGNTMVASASAQANGSGVVSVPITAANANTIANGEPVTIVRPGLLRPTDSINGSVVRLLSSVGGTNLPNASTPGIRSTAFAISVPTGQTRMVTAAVSVAMGKGVYNLGQQPAVAIINADTGAILGSARVSDGPVEVAGSVTWVRLVCQAVISGNVSVALAAYGGSTSAPALWTALLDAILAVTTATDLPYIDDSHANVLAMRGIEYQLEKRVPVPNIRCSWGTLLWWADRAASSAPAVLGQKVTYPDLGVSRRILQIERSMTSHDIEVEVGTVPTDLSRRVAALAASLV